MTSKKSFALCNLLASSLMITTLVISPSNVVASEKSSLGGQLPTLYKATQKAPKSPGKKNKLTAPQKDQQARVLRAIMPMLYLEIDQLVKEHKALTQKSSQKEEVSFKDYLIGTLFPQHQERIRHAGISEDAELKAGEERLKLYKKSPEKREEAKKLEAEIRQVLNKQRNANEEPLSPEEMEAYLDNLENPTQKGEAETAKALLAPERLPTALKEKQQTVTHGEYNPADERPLSLTDKIEQLLTTGDYYFLADNVDRARTYYIQAVEQGARFKNSPLYARALVKLADIEENRYLARFQYSNALDIYELNAKEHQEAIADVLEKLVWTFDFTSERDVAFEILNRAKSIREARPYTPKYTETLRALAWFHEINNEFVKAEKHYQKAIDLDLEHLTARDIRTVLALENYAQFFIDYEKYEKAEKVLRLKLKEHLAITPPDYYNLGRTQSMLGWTLLKLGKQKAPLKYFTEALGNINYSLTKHRFIPHYYSLPALFDLIYYHTQNGEYERAEIYFNTAKIILTEAGEEDILDYLRYTEKQEITDNGIGGFPWSLEAQVEGAQAMFEYLDYQKITAELEALEAEHQSKIQILEALDNTHLPDSE